MRGSVESGVPAVNSRRTYASTFLGLAILIVAVYGFFFVGNPVLIARSDTSQVVRLDGREIVRSERLYPTKPVYHLSVTSQGKTREYELYPWASEDSASVVATKGELHLNIRYKRVK